MKVPYHADWRVRLVVELTRYSELSSADRPATVPLNRVPVWIVARAGAVRGRRVGDLLGETLYLERAVVDRVGDRP